MGKSTKIPVSFRFTEEEQRLLDQAAGQFDGNKTKAAVEGLRLLINPKKLTKEQLIAELQRRLK